MVTWAYRRNFGVTFSSLCSSPPINYPSLTNLIRQTYLHRHSTRSFPDNWTPISIRLILEPRKCINRWSLWPFAAASTRSYEPCNGTRRDSSDKASYCRTAIPFCPLIKVERVSLLQYVTKNRLSCCFETKLVETHTHTRTRLRFPRLPNPNVIIETL